MSAHYTSTTVPTPLPEDTLLHWDGEFFCLLCVASWVLFIWMWAWNHKPRHKASKPLLPKEEWETPNRWN
jgi:hypothetical protein